MSAVATRYETVIGLEVHCQLTTRSKMFCGCSADYSGAEPNTHVCPVCLGMPGVLPVINERAIEYIVITGLALHCEIAEFSKFDRKNYPYPDLMKGYQISQYDLPLCRNGWLDVEVNGERRRVGITRVHMEEDTARLLHRTDSATGQTYSLIDVNRSGTPLMEIVSEPDIRSAEEAREYLVRLRQILRYIGVSEANMEEGNFRCDANISLRPVGSSTFGTKVEIKNMNSFRAVHDALLFEERRQAAQLDGGERIIQETRGWVDERQETVSQRSKEEANDYRYFPEPDLPPLKLSREFVEELRRRLPELPEKRQDRFLTLGLSDHEAATLTESRERADYFEAVLSALRGTAEPSRAAKLAANWTMGEVARWQNTTGRNLEELRVTPESLAELIGLAERGNITAAVAKEVFEKMAETGRGAKELVEEGGLAQIGGEDELSGIVRKVIEGNEKAVADYRAGKDSAVKFLVGQVMRETRGRANPQKAQELLAKELG
ncbi:MAG TPA: Asp-tRNA(Asn)/Glu-tRNA(Gln) amidotransferase subunit GatB [Tepidiformaceae bacterium]|nr:Asp-tRNA(Asn)/Glu-tRNA(Gln) amidotransferase subunit GatB [Tepidiformaceae bacterium]HSE43950.1 Asp-tRNA(Asn)/Glu-tRNA(Gln) amidotransferase subunit GatB [Gemmatimonadales bacterium]